MDSPTSFAEMWQALLHRRRATPGPVALSLLLILGLTASLGALAVADPDPRTLTTTTAVATVVAQLLIGVAALLVYLTWRLDTRDDLTWLVGGLAAVAVHAVLIAVVSASTPRGEARPDGFVTGQVLVVVALVVLTVARRHDYRPDPVWFGVSVGGAAAVTSVASVLSRQPLPLGAPVAVHLEMAAVGLVIAALLSSLVPQDSSAPGRRLRTGLLVGTVLLALGQGAAGSAPGSPARSLVTAICLLAGAGTVTAVTLSATRNALRGTRRAVNRLTRDVDQLTSETRRDRARLHEVGATLAGIAAASTLLHDDVVEEDRRLQLERLVDAEVARLQRITSQDEGVVRMSDGTLTTDLDRVLEPLVESHRVRGCAVEWQPAGCLVEGRADTLATVLNVLLENAQRHAPDSRVHVRTLRTDQDVVVLVSDTGPGVPSWLRPTIFDWGRSRPGSPGQGIGLAIARRFAREAGGELMLLPTNGSGATFALELAAAPETGQR